MTKHFYLKKTVMELTTSAFLLMISQQSWIASWLAMTIVFFFASFQHVLKSPARIPGWCLAAAGTPGCCPACEKRHESGKTAAASAAGVFWRFPSRLPEDVPHDQPETLLQSRGPCEGAQQYLHYQDISQPLHAGNTSCQLSDQSTKECFILCAFL